MLTELLVMTKVSGDTMSQSTPTKSQASWCDIRDRQPLYVSNHLVNTLQESTALEPGSDSGAS